MDDDTRYDDSRYDDTDGGALDEGRLDGGVPDDDERERAAPDLALPGFEVHHLLGAGATGQVWLAREERSGDLVALKRLHDPGDAAGRERLLREAVLLAGFTHDHLIRLRSVQADGDGAPVLVLDHAAGGSLAALLARRGRLEPGEVVTVAAPLAQALAASHAAGLVHADVTPANVLFDATGRPLLADLGVSRLVGERRAVVESTADYLDPVVAAGGEPTPATDVHALAAVCHHLLTGSPPYTGPSLVQVLRAAAAGQRTPLRTLAPAVPPALLEVVEEGLASDPAARPTADVFADRLLAAVPALPVQLRAGGRPPVPPTGPPVGSGIPSVAVRPSRWRRGRTSRATPAHSPAAPASIRPALSALGGAPQTGSPGLVGAGLLGASDPDPGWSSGPAQPRPTHAVPVRPAEPTSIVEPLADLPGWRERCREALRGRRAVVAASGLALALLVGGSVVVSGAAAVGEDLDGPLAVAAPAADTGSASGTSTGAADGADAAIRSGATESTGATEPTDATESIGTTGSLPEQAERRRADPAHGELGSGSPQPRAAGGAVATPDTDDWHSIVDRLAALRASAFSGADPQALERVYAPGSEALPADREVVGSLAAAGLTIEGVRHEIREVTLLEELPGRVRLRVLDLLPEHRVLDRTGAVLEVRPATSPGSVEMELVEVGDGWRIASVGRT